jgi:hypothetical protein
MRVVNYANLLNANEGVLAEACSIMNEAGIEYAVVGG